MKRALTPLRRVSWIALKALAALLVTIFVVVGVINGLPLIMPRSLAPPTAVPPGSFAFAALGDAPYSQAEFELFDVVLEDLGAHDLTSVVHVGDIFSELCRDEAYIRTLGVFNDIPHPVVYTPGDNEWTDCFSMSAETDRYTRLASIRRILVSDPSNSLGARTIPLDHQGDDPEHGEFPENARWTHEGIVFATIHLVGSANATRAFRDRTEAEEQEPARRTEAAAAWVRETFVVAEEMDAIAVVIAFHAYVFFEDAHDMPRRQPYEPFLLTLEEEVARFGRPVLGIHGDFHEFIVDQPLIDRSTGQTLENFTRMQVPGSPDVGWVHITVTPGADDLFDFESRVVPNWPW